MMAVYRIKAPDGRTIKVQANDEATAIKGAQEWAAANPVQQAAPSSTGGPALPPPGLKPGTREYADWAAAKARAGATLPQVSNPEYTQTQSSALDPFVQGVTFGWGDELRGAVQGGLAAAQGGDFGSVYNQTVDEARNALEQERRVNPWGALGAELGGGVASTVLASRLLGPAAGPLGFGAAPGATLGQRMVLGGAASVIPGAIYGAGAADTNKAEGAMGGGAMGGVVGFAAPLVGATVNAAGRWAGNTIGPVINSAINPEGEAARRLGTAFLRDAQASPQSVMGQADELAAQQSGVPLMNVDRGGETVRALARSTANQSPEARQVITKAADDRFETQGLRAIDFIKRLTGGQADDLAYQQAIKDTAKMVNTPRYQAAWEAPGARAIWTPQIRQLMQSPQFQMAVRMAETRGADKAAISGFKAVKNPFTFSTNGTIGLRTNPDGSKALPSLQFWNQVKINLDGMIERAQRGAKPDRGLYADLTQMKQMLVQELDAAVPQYRAARQGAAAFFDADDALEAGKKFANQPRNVPEAKRAFASFNDAEKQAFQTGYASELIDRIRSTRDRVNVINQVFGNQSSREMIDMVFGSAKARQLEAYIRVENLADMIRGALGNSTTARQLMELGIGGVGGFALTGGDWTGALTGAALARGSRWAGQKVDAQVMEKLAKLLTSRNPSDLQRAIANATMSQQWMKGLEAMERALEAPARAGVISAVNQ